MISHFLSTVKNSTGFISVMKKPQISQIHMNNNSHEITQKSQKNKTNFQCHFVAIYDSFFSANSVVSL